METLVLVGGFIFIGAFGFWIMGKIDRFLDSGGFSTYWDEEEQNAASLKKDTDAPAARGGAAAPQEGQATAKELAPRS